MEENRQHPVYIPTGTQLVPAPANFAVQDSAFIYDRYATGETQYYDLSHYPYELTSASERNPQGQPRQASDASA